MKMLLMNIVQQVPGLADAAHFSPCWCSFLLEMLWRVWQCLALLKAGSLEGHVLITFSWCRWQPSFLPCCWPSCPRGWQIPPLEWECELGPAAVPVWQGWAQEGIEAPVLCTPPAEFEVSKYVFVILCWLFIFFKIRCGLLKDIRTCSAELV